MIIALIPARAGSKRIPNKNLQTIAGHSLVGWSCMVAKAVPSIDEVWVSSEDKEILIEAENYGVYSHVRPQALAEDDVADLPVIQDFLQALPNKPTAVVYLRPTTPFRDPDVVEKAIQEIRQAGAKVSGLRSIQELEEPPYKCFWIQLGLLQPFDTWEQTEEPSQIFEETYKPNGYIDICRPDVVWSDVGPWGRSVIGFKTKPTIEIDTPWQLKLARALAEYRFEGEQLIRFVAQGSDRTEPFEI